MNTESFAYKNHISEQTFKRLSDIIRRYSGISLNNTKKELVKNRLAKRLRALDIDSLNKYFKYLNSERENREIPFLIDAISTNVTSFFRERAHYRYLYEHALPAVSEVPASLSFNKKVRIWSAACSSGEEPYSIAMVADTFFEDKQVDLKILATDICSNVLRTAEKRVYPRQSLDTVPDYFIDKYFDKFSPGRYAVSAEIARYVQFRRLNLTRSSYPFMGKFDIIFCRNVLIYFDDATQGQLIDRLKRYLSPGGYLFLGHAESLNGKSEGFKYMSPAIYRKVV